MLQLIKLSIAYFLHFMQISVHSSVKSVHNRRCEEPNSAYYSGIYLDTFTEHFLTVV